MSHDESVAKKLDALVRLTAIQVIGERTGAEAIAVLARAGLDNDLIADVVGASTATVRSARSRAGRDTKKRRQTGASS